MIPIFLQNNKYKIISVLGQGGYGITYLATQVLLDRKVAIKEFFMKDYCERSDQSAEVTMGTRGSREMILRYREKFKKEAMTLARFAHVHIVRVIDIFEENNTCYYVMEYADGPSLNKIIKERGVLPQTEALAIIRQVAEAVGFIHNEHVCHYDIKPANILSNSKGLVLLADFGLAKQYDEQGEETSTTPVGKSKGYASIEQYQAGGVSEFSPETDIYALAATLYKLLTGVTPVESIIRAEKEIDFQLLPASFIAPIKKAMNLKRKDRFQTVEEFMEALPNVVEEEKHCDEETNFDELDEQDKKITLKSEELTNPELIAQKSKEKRSLYLPSVAVLCVIVACALLFFKGNFGDSKGENSPTLQDTIPTQQIDSFTIEETNMGMISQDENKVDIEKNDIENRTLYYTSTNHQKMDLIYKLVENNPTPLRLINNEYKDGQGKAIFDGPIETVGCLYDWRLQRLSSIHIPNSTKNIYSNFFNFDQLEKFYGKYASQDHQLLIKDDTLKAIAYGFKGYDLANSKNSPKLKDIFIPEGVKVIDNLPQCRIKSLTLPQSLVSISIDAILQLILCDRFYGKYASKDHCSVVYNGILIAASNDVNMTNFDIPSNAQILADIPNHLSKIYIPKTIKKIYRWTFANRWSVETIYCESTTPPILMTSSEFDSANNLSRILVPKSALDKYKHAEKWSKYSDKIFAMDE